MARQSLGSLATKLFGVGCGFLFAVAIARLLGAHGYGLVAVALSVANIVAIVALLGANELAVREVSASTARSDWTRLRTFVRWSSYTILASGTLASLIVASAAFIAGPYRNVLLIGSMTIPFLAGLYLIRGVNQGARNIVASQLPMDVVRWILALAPIGLLFIIRAQPSAQQILIIVVISYAVALAYAAIRLRRHLQSIPKIAVPAGNSRLLLASLPFLTVALLGIAATEMNTLLLGLISGPRDAGLYQPIAKIAPLMVIANEAIEVALAPRVAAMWETGNLTELSRLIRRSAVVSTLATIVVIGTILAASPLIFAAFGSEFRAYSHYLYWIAAAHAANAAFGASSLLLSMAGDMKRRIQAQTVTLLVQAIFTTTLVPILGVGGAVIALSIQIVAWAAVNWFLAKRSTGIDTSAFSAARAWLGPSK